MYKFTYTSIFTTTNKAPQPQSLTPLRTHPSLMSLSTPSPSLPINALPGDYGMPFFGAIKDRLDFFYFQGKDKFFQSRIDKYKSTVFKTNMPPGPFISSDPKVICLLDAKSFPVLFDVSKIEKKDLFTGTYIPSLKLTGGYRVLSYLDPSETNHTRLKTLLFFLLKSSSSRVIPEFHTTFTDMFVELETELASKGSAALANPNDQACFNFLGKAFYGVNPLDTKLGDAAPGIITKWVFLQLGPIITLGLPWFIEDPLLHTFPLPSLIVKSDYNKLYDFIYSSAGPILDEGEKLGLKRDEACHNLLFATCFNTFGGMKIFFPSMIKWIGEAGSQLHRQLAEEIRSVVKSNGGKVTMAGLEKMELMKSVVYEAFRIDPPVPYQYGKAKQDMVIESHDGSFQVKKGEMLFGFQPFATKDSKIFNNADKFVPDRFVGEGEKLLKYVVWSNGPETETPTVDNKQCAGKNFVVLVSRLLVVELFLRYDTYGIEVGTSPLGSTVTIKSLTNATF